MTEPALALIAGLLLLVLVGLFSCRLDPVSRWAREFQRTVSARQPLSDEELASIFSTPETIDPRIPIRVRQMLAKHTGYPVEKLLPDDDLTPFWDELDALDLILDLEETFDIQIDTHEAERTRCTIRAVSELIGWKRKRLQHGDGGA
jgi:acyl carrier protein